MTDRIEIINDALLRIGQDALMSEQDPGAEVHLAVYRSTLEQLGSHPFTFLKQTLQLTADATKPAHWACRYRLPGDRLGPPRAVFDQADARTPISTYDLEGDYLLASSTQIWITYTRAMPPHRWPGDFRELFKRALMAHFALSVREERTLHRELYAQCFGSLSEAGRGGLLLSCLENDSQARPATQVGMGYSPLVAARR